VFKKRVVIMIRFKDRPGILQSFSRGSLRGSRWLEARLQKLSRAGANGKAVLAALWSGLRVVTRQGRSRRHLARAVAPMRRMTVAAPVVAKAACVRKRASEGHNNDGASDDPGGGSDDDPASHSPRPRSCGVKFPSLKSGRFFPSWRPRRPVLMRRVLASGGTSR
jgi:hypothetical protein